MENKIQIDWSKYFDRIFCVFFLPNKERMERIKNELERVGILNSTVFEWRFTVPSQVDKRIQDSYSDKKWVESIGAINGSLEQTRIFKESLLLGYNRILILEDDVAFLKDISLIKEMLDNIPEGYDVIQCDKGIFRCDVRKWESTCQQSINEYFTECKEFHFGLSDANIYTRNGMTEAVRILEDKPIFVDQIWRFGKFKWAVAKQSMCIQVFFGNSNCNSNKRIHDIYLSVGVDYMKYELPEGYGYGSLYNPLCKTDVRLKKTDKTITPSAIKNRWDRFDYIGLVCYTGYKDRIDEIKPELYRVGLTDRVNYHWDFPSAFTDRLSSVVKKTPFCSKQGCFNMLVKHYNIVKTAYELGCENVLVIEDDMRFLKDLNAIDDILDNIPFGYDHLMFDRNVDQPEELERLIQDSKANQKNTWVKFIKGGSTGCYALSRRGMRHYLDLIEYDLMNGKVHNPDWYFWENRKGRLMWDETYKRYCSYPNMAVQSIAGKKGSFTNLHDFYWIYLNRGGIVQEDYNLSFPIVTKDNFKELLYSTFDKQDHSDRNGLGFCSDNSWVIMSKYRNCSTEMNKGLEFDRSFMWGMYDNEDNSKALQVALRDGAQLNVCEIGLIFGTGKRDGHSFVSDNRGVFFDGTRKTQLEMMIEDRNIIVSESQKEEARRLIKKIVTNKVTTYNNQPITSITIGRQGAEKVLVVDQTKDLCELGMVNDDIFKEMLESAVRDNPDADIIVKTHPNSSESEKSFFHDLKGSGNIYKISSLINPYSLIELCDKVYVGYSTMGFEALLAGKEVHTFGMPFYAGWGLTIDAQHLERRTNKRTIEELFYIYCIMYTHWVDPDKGCETTIDDVIDKMIALRNECNHSRHKTNNTYSKRMKIEYSQDSYEPFAARINRPKNMQRPNPYRQINNIVHESRGFIGGVRNGVGMFF